jgi:hypothetical protein
MVVGLLGAAFVIFRSCPAGSATGEIRSTGKSHGDFVVRPVTCFAGGHWGFEGVWVVPETQTTAQRRGFKGGLKIMKHDTGQWEAHVENPLVCQGFKCEQRRVERRHCRLFDVVVGSRSLWLRQSGHARLDCGFPEGGTLRVDLTFKGCAEVASGGAEP